MSSRGVTLNLPWSGYPPSHGWTITELVESLDPLKTKYFESLFINAMATKGRAAKSASGAAMSKYDVEVEERLQALETKMEEVSRIIIERYSPGGSASAEERVEGLVQTLKTAFPGKLQDL